ncbi:hypothetical protein IIC68_00230 [archaeon]|nr:hypothetical protein [archaeon]
MAIDKIELVVHPLYDYLKGYVSVNEPFTRHSKLDNLFSTHPPISERIARLEKL